jgi:hypothetical protein
MSSHTHITIDSDQLEWLLDALRSVAAPVTRRDRMDRMVAALLGGYMANGDSGWIYTNDDAIEGAAAVLDAIDRHLEEEGGA